MRRRGAAWRWRLTGARVGSPAPRVCLRVKKKRTLRRTFWNGLRCFSGPGELEMGLWALVQMIRPHTGPLLVRLATTLSPRASTPTS